MKAYALFDRLTAASVRPPNTPVASDQTDRSPPASQHNYAQELKKTLDRRDQASSVERNVSGKKTTPDTPSPLDSGSPEKVAANPEHSATPVVTPAAVPTLADDVTASALVPTESDGEIELSAPFEFLRTAEITLDVELTPPDPKLADTTLTPAKNSQDSSPPPFDLQSAIESLLGQLEELTQNTSPSSESEVPFKKAQRQHENGEIPPGLQQAFDQISQQTNAAPVAPQSAQTAQQAINLIEALIARLGADKNDEVDQSDETEADISDDLAKLQSLLNQLTTQTQTTATIEVTIDVASTTVDPKIPVSLTSLALTPDVAATPLADSNAENIDSNVTLNQAPATPETLEPPVAPSAGIAPGVPSTETPTIDLPVEQATSPVEPANVSSQAPGTPRSLPGVITAGATPVDEGARQTAAIQLIERVSQSISTGTTRSEQTFKMQIDVPELGQLQIEVTTQKGSVSAIISAEQSSTHKLLVDHLQQLKESLSVAGHQVDRILIETAPDGSLFEDFLHQESTFSDQQDEEDQGVFRESTGDADSEQFSQPTSPHARPVISHATRDQLDIAI